MQQSKSKAKRPSPQASTKRSLSTVHKPRSTLQKKQRLKRKTPSQSLIQSTLTRPFSTAPPGSEQLSTPNAPASAKPQHKSQVLYDAPLLMKERLAVLGTYGLGTFTSLQVVAGLIYSPDSSILVPALITAATIGMSGFWRKSLRNRATSMVVNGPEDPVIITTPGLFTQNVSHPIARDRFRGLPRSVDSKAFFDPKRPFYCLVKDRKHPFLLNRSGLFDTSGPLNELLGYDIVTFERCHPSLPYRPRPNTKTADKSSEATKQQQRDV